VRDQTLFDVCMVLGLDFDKLKSAWNGTGTTPSAPAELQGENGGVVSPLFLVFVLASLLLTPWLRRFARRARDTRWAPPPPLVLERPG